MQNRAWLRLELNSKFHHLLQIDDYLDSLPDDKKPIAGTEGAQYRKKQLMRQLPAHDQEPSECHDLTPQETEEMKLFVKKYKEKALGVANVEEEGKPKVSLLRWRQQE